MVEMPNNVDKYQILEQLEEGNYALVFKVSDPNKNIFVLKIAREKIAEYNELVSREFQILAQFKHPNIAAVHDFNIVDGRAYFTLDYIQGKPLNEHFQGFSEDFIAAIIQVISALGAFHNKGFIHSDLKPEHILYDPGNKKAVLIDFGFAQARLDGQINLAGTIGYIAPEVIKGIGLDQRSDLYSLGIIIYEIIAGKKFQEPFSAIAQIPETLNKTISRLIAQEPALRPTIPELFKIFGKFLPKQKLKPITYKVDLPSFGFVQNLEISADFLASKGKALIIYGDMGSGKTRLLQELKFKFLAQGNSVLYYCAREKTKFFESLKNAFVLKDIDFANQEDRFQIYEEVLTALKNTAQNRKIVIMADDLDLFSDYDLALFRYIGYGIKNTDILLIGATHPVDKVKDLGFDELHLKAFSLEQTKQLLEKTFFELKTSPAATSIDFAQWLYKQSGGNPVFIEEILRALHKNKIISYQNNQWRVASEKVKTARLPAKIEDFLALKTKALNPQEMRILKILSSAGTPLETSIVSKLLKAENEISIEHLRNLGLIRETIIIKKRLIYPTNQSLANLIMKKIERKEKRSLYQALIDTIKTLVPEEKAYTLFLAQLYEKIGDKNSAYQYYQVVTQNAESIYDYEAAKSYYEILLKYEKELLPKKCPGTLTKIAKLNQMLGNTKKAIEYYDHALEYKRKDLVPTIYSELGNVYSSIGEYGEAVKYFKKATALTKDKENQDLVKIAVYSFLYLNQLEDVKIVLSHAFLLQKKASREEILAETMYFQVLYEWLKGNLDTSITKARENLKFAQENNLIRQVAFTENLLSFLYQQKNDISQAQKYLSAAINIFKEIRLSNVLVDSLNSQAILYLSQGDLSKAQQLCEDVQNRAQQTNNRAALYICLVNLGRINGDLGKFDEAVNAYERALRVKPDGLVSNYNLAMLFLRRGEIDKARSHIENNLPKHEAHYLLATAMINAAEGRPEQAEAHVSKGLEVIEGQSLSRAIKISAYLDACQFYLEKKDFEKALVNGQKIVDLTVPTSREYNIGGAFIKICKFMQRTTTRLDIDKELTRLKEVGCIYDYAYLKKLQIEMTLNQGLTSEEIKNTIQDTNAIQEIFSTIGAGLALVQFEKLKAKLFPIIARDYSSRTVSIEYLEAFSRIAELINAHLGDKDFIQNTLDLIIPVTRAERGALFLKSFSAKGEMEYVAGRNIDQTTIKDADELSQTAIKKLTSNEIIFAQDALSDPQFSAKKSVMLNQIRALLCIPLSISGNVIGALYLDSRIASGIFGPKDKDFLLSISKILASVIDKSIAFRSVTEENILLKSNIVKEIGSGYLVGKSRVMKEIYKLMDSVAQTNSTVSILGETGTGKGMIARLIHLKSQRQGKKFLAINCGTIPETLLESELFGYKKGAFTGAVNDKKGLLEEGEGGTIFLDEISNTTLTFQGKLLEAIEEKTIRRVGETQMRKIDVRFLFATNKDLEIEVEEGRFRKDLLYRINVFTIEVPPLRERASDIPLLAQFFLERYNKEIGKKFEGFTPETMRSLSEYMWLGNVRELQNVIERAVVLAKGNLITLKDIGFEKTGQMSGPLKDLKKEAIIKALNATNWSIKKAAEMLNINRRTIERYIRKYNLTKNKA